MHIPIEPSILYFGTPVVLVTTLNPDGSPNVAPISSVWWLGWNAMLGFGARSQTPQNLLREGECVLNLPSIDQAPAVNRLARLTASDPVPPHKLAMGYQHDRKKFEAAMLTRVEATLVKAPRVAECPIQLEAVVEESRAFGHAPYRSPTAVGIEVRIVRAWVDESIRLDGHENRIDPDRWRPLIMSFCQFYGLGPRLQDSTLAQIPESAYRPAAHMS
jgi:flavin reductase (DIM6/NTAB) family NADH-FMN oxidoreductase RutF